MPIAVEPTPAGRIRAYARDFPGLTPQDIAKAMRNALKLPHVTAAEVAAALRAERSKPRKKSIAPSGPIA
jgi:uncharacterized protein (DUF433 family)